MAQILPQNPGSTEIQSPLIAGITEGLNKISATLSLKIGDLSDVSLSAVPIDSSDKNKNRIYEVGTGNRLWLPDPAPVIKKNGEVIEQTSERFTIDYVGGSITFPEDSKPSDSDTLTVTCKYIIGTSETISQIQDQLSQTSENALKYKGYFETEGDLKLEHPTASDGDFALVMSPLTIYAWTSGGWKDTRADANLDAHLADFNNPHRVDTDQIGAETPEGAQAKADAAKAAAISASDPKGSADSVKNGILDGSIVASKSVVTERFENSVNVSVSGAVTGSATGFNGSRNLDINTTGLDVSKANSGILPVSRGGTGSDNVQNAVYNLGASVRENILRNSHFYNGVLYNPSGKTEFHYPEKNGFADWELEMLSGAGGIYVAESGIRLVPGTSSRIGITQQYNSYTKSLIGKRCTVSLIDGNGDLHGIEFTLGAAEGGSKLGKFTVFSTPYILLYVRVYNEVASEATLRAVKLEIGADQSLARKNSSDDWELIDVPNTPEMFAGNYGMWKCTQQEYDAIGTKDPNTLYLISG